MSTGKICWDFPLLGTGNKTGNNNAALALFQMTGVMDGLAREICQNSLDAKNKDLNGDMPVKVKFELVYINKNDYPMFAEYEEMVANSRKYWESNSLKTAEIMTLLDNIQDYLQIEKIPVLLMSDYNTNGLMGVNAPPSEKSFWDLLVNYEGVSIKQDETSLGSYGIGKYAPFAYSALNLVFYNTLAKDGGRAFQGVTHLVTSQREYNNSMRPTQSTGKYLYLKDMFTGRPILPEDNCALANLEFFHRSEKNFGTDVAIFGFKTEEYANWEIETVAAVIKNFTLAIMEGKLEVTVKNGDTEYIVDKNSIEKLLFDTLNDVKAINITQQVYKTLTEPDDGVKRVKILEDEDLSIYVKFGENFQKIFSRFRGTGMLINRTEESFPHFSIVIVVNDVGNNELSKLLREAEPPQHTEWKGKNVKNNPRLREKVNRNLRKIRSEVQKVMENYIRIEIPEVIDAGTGEYFQGEAGNFNIGESEDGLKIDLKVKEIKNTEGVVLFDRQRLKDEAILGETAIGTPNGGYAVRAGTRKRRRRKRVRIRTVDPGGKTVEQPTRGVAPTGRGKVKVQTLKFIDNRIFYLANNRYKLLVNSPKEYDNVFIECFAGRDDSNEQDPIMIKNVKLAMKPLQEINEAKIGPLTLKEGHNEIIIEFVNDELMAITPQFSMEVHSEK